MDQDPRDRDDSAADDDGPMSVPDKDLPEDLQPDESHPLAQPAGDDVPDDVLTQDAGHDDSSGGPEDASAPGDDGAAGGTTSSNEASSGAG
jgi:hypothetical protein